MQLGTTIVATNLSDQLDVLWLAMDASTAQAPPIDLSHHYSRTTKNRNASAVKDFYKYFRIPNIGNLAGGLIALSKDLRPPN